MPAAPRQPTLYIPHGGGPCFFMDWNPPGTWDRMADFLRGLLATLPARPRAILVVSGHWLAPRFTVGTAAAPTLIYDYHGFPRHTYRLTFPARGEPTLGATVARLLAGAGLPAAQDAARGWDHGVFIPLMLVAPDADIPVLQLSLRGDLDAQAHLDAGRALAPLRDDGVLIVGSGMSFHNMRGYGDARFGPVSDRFDAWLGAAVEAAPGVRATRLAAWSEAPDARLAHPPRAEEHLLPLMVAAGAAPAGAGRRIFSDRVMETTVSAFRFD
ncbi:DODA-type extradiol aromatic ring-opening family dioxygenase [Coralloluteibacterium stylophorae]|uniref:Dioxygenase n=1 Tax=Coralloluteibacterium stylophorae TaxID=1776034 RepID=A0A8J7VVN4_9GAMM|nr:class III extradiol ring-cleavage dioxygenase [Coralloluteibacterium stylophorae]MBS7458194.1 dioxygenase [Coralloluteibacterium stylophorae]